ncbi:MAG TPA: DUF222 domain-containing protein, partial [Ilumatobacteraceae bacterium]
MGEPGVTALELALSSCADTDLSLLSGSALAGLVVDLRRVASRLEAHIAAVVHAADAVGVWHAVGATSMEAWLAEQTHVSFRTARDQVRLASTLAAAPLVAESMADGALSVDNARLLGTVVGEPGFAGDAEVLIELAAGSPRDTRRRLEQWRATNDPAGETAR